MDAEKRKITFCARSPEKSFKRLHDTCNWNQPHNVAIEYHDLEDIIYITYRELLISTNMISDYLKGLKTSEFVGINHDIPEYCVVSIMLGILSADHSFVNAPQDVMNMTNLRNQLKVHYIFCKHINIEGDIDHKFVIHSEQIYLIKLKNTQSQSRSGMQDDFAYGIATSGSTGMAKVVRVLHACIVSNIVDLSKILEVKSCDKITQFTNFTFDPSIVEIFLAISTGGTLFMPSKALRQDPNRLLEKAYSSQITIMQITPTVFLHTWGIQRLKSTILSNNTSLRAVLLGGEQFPKLELLSKMKHPQNNTRFYNIYGITEVSCWASVNEIVFTNKEYNVNYLGHEMLHTLFEVRNESGEVIEDGTGFLYIGSNQRVCVIDDEDISDLELPVFRDSGDIVNIDKCGRIYYKGRRNKIVKRYGNKMNLNVLEECVLELDFIKNCYPIWDNDLRQLHLCLANTENVTNQESVIKCVMKHLEKLGHLYRPDKIHLLERIQFTQNGKVSMQFLKENYVKQDNEIKPTNGINFQEIEERFKSIWKDSLIDLNGGFIKLGGTSIAALQISNTIHNTFDMEFPDLITMLLKDSSLTDCLSYIKTTLLSNTKHDARNNDPTMDFNNVKRIPSINTITIDKEAAPKLKVRSCDLLTETDNISTCQWCKCRGKKSTSSSTSNEEAKIKYDMISRVKVLSALDLKKCVDASPNVFHYSDGNTYVSVGSHSGYLYTFDLRNKSDPVLFDMKLPDRIEASVLILDNYRGIVGCYDGNVYCFHWKSRSILWKYKTGDIVKCTAILDKEKEQIFIGSYDCHVYCLSTKDGSEIWKTKCSDGSVTATGCLHFPSSTVLFGTLDGTCVAIKRLSGEITWKRKLSDPVFVAPVSLNNGNVLFCSVTGNLCCFDVEVNIKLWTYNTNGNVFSYLLQRYDITLKHEDIIIASQNKNIYCLRLEDIDCNTGPKMQYVLRLHSQIFSTPWCINEFLFASCTDGTINIYNSQTNKLIRIEKLPGEIYSSPVVENDMIIVGCRDNNVYVLKLS